MIVTVERGSWLSKPTHTRPPTWQCEGIQVRFARIGNGFEVEALDLG